jgi:hypothetical protein
VRSIRRLPVIAVGLLACAACDADKAGELVVAVSTDMAMPQQIDTLRMRVEMQGELVHNLDYPVGSTLKENMIPGTLTLVSGDRHDAVTITLIGLKKSSFRTFREITTTVPSDRSALLRMPIQWLCDESTKAIAGKDQRGVAQIRQISACDGENTCIAGVCRPNVINSSKLPPYRPRDVFGNASNPENGECFDTIPCMVAGRVVEPDADCTVAAPEGAGAQANVALRVTDDGICDTTGTVCFVPLDAEDPEGWTYLTRNDRLQLPEAVCNRIKTRRINAVYVSDVSPSCPPKRASIPPCGPWSSVGQPKDAAGEGTAGTSAPTIDEPDFPRAKLVATVIREGSGGSICCPLMADAGKTYTCVCTSKTNATLVSIDVATGASTIVGSLNPPSGRDNLRFPAAVFADALYWAADEQIRRTPVVGGSALASEFPVGGAVYESTSLLAANGRIYVLATAVNGAQGAPVQLLAIDAMSTDPARAVTSFDTGGTQPVFQFGQDDDAVYLAVAVDSAGDAGRTRRTSSVMRLQKSNGMRTNVLPEKVLDLADPLRGGGYTGVQVDGGLLFALFENMPAADGTLKVQVMRVDLAQQGSAQAVYETTLDRNLSQLAILGVVDGVVVLSRIEYEVSDGMKSVRSSSVIMVPANDAGPRIIADYPRDYPGDDLVSDDDRIYWLNSSGLLYGFPRARLQ